MTTLERTASFTGTRRPSFSRPVLPSLASWAADDAYTPTRSSHRYPPTSAGSYSSVEAEEAVTPLDAPPRPPTSLKMPSPIPPPASTFKAPSLKPAAKLSSFKVQAIPPFRRNSSNSSASSSTSAPPAAAHAPAPAPLPVALPPSLSTVQNNSRRASVASVFSLPRPNPPSQPPPPAPIAMGLGIEGCGVGSGGAKETLVIERLGETSSNGRRGSLKRVLAPEEDDEQHDMIRTSTSSRDSERCVSSPSRPLASLLPLAPLRSLSRRKRKAGSSRGNDRRFTASRSTEEATGSSVHVFSAVELRLMNFFVLSFRLASLLPFFSVARRSRLEPDSRSQHQQQHRRGSTSLAPGARQGSSSPPQPAQRRDSPSNKRARTRLSPLESLAATATNLLARPTSSSSAASSSSTAVPPPPPHPLDSASLTDKQRAELAAAQAMREQQQQENERRELAANGGRPPPGSVQAALGKLKAAAAAGQEGGEASTGSSSRKSSGLGKRRGHRPAPVNTAGGSSASSSSSSTARAHPYQLPHGSDQLAPPRSAPVDIPSVLVGSPVDPSFAARAARELPPMRVQPPAPPSSGPARRQSRSGAADREERGHPSVSAQQQQQQQAQQPPLVSSSSYYIRPNQPLGPGVPYPSASTPTASSSSASKQRPPPPHHSSSSRQPSPQTSYHPLQRPPSQSGLPSHYQHGPISPLPPMQVQGGHSHHPHPHAHSHPHHDPRTAPGPRSSPSFAPQTAPLPPSYPSHHHPPPHTAPLASSSSSAPRDPSSSSSSSSSKQAFLSLFSTFYDSLSDSRVLTSNLEGQIHRAAALLQTLQNAEGVFERLVEEKVSRVERVAEERWRSVERRVTSIEERVLGGAGPLGVGGEGGVETQAQAGERRGSGESTETALTSASVVEDRLDRLERVLLDQQTEARAAMLEAPSQHGGSSSRPSTAEKDRERSRERERRPASIMEDVEGEGEEQEVHGGDEEMRED
ncbi:hypothetical protein JCM8547_005039 [Rhodosporidiobolus lusitaniae]